MSGKGFANSNRRDRLPSNWGQIRQRIIKRDGGLCQWSEKPGEICGARGTDVDHKKRGGLLGYEDDSDENLWLLCGWHHRRKTAREGSHAFNQKRREIQRRFGRPPETHPGIISVPDGTPALPWQVSLSAGDGP